MLARRLLGILPPMTLDGALDLTTTYNFAGAIGGERGIVHVRPFCFRTTPSVTRRSLDAAPTPAQEGNRWSITAWFFSTSFGDNRGQLSQPRPSQQSVHTVPADDLDLLIVRARNPRP